MTVGIEQRRWRRTVSFLTVVGMLWSLLAVALPAGAEPAAAAAIPTPVTTGVPRYEAAPCVYELPDGLTEGQQIVCGYVVVAEKHANPGGKTIKLPVAIVKAINPTPAAEPIVLLAGGPGQSGQVFATLADPSQPFYKAVAANNDVVFFDQRGTGKSQPTLICTEFESSSRLRLKQPLLRAFEIEETFVSLANACRDRLVGQGIDLSAYTTTENAADVNDVRLALGYSKINIIGASYGSELGLAVGRDWNQFVRTNNLASLVPIQETWYFEPPQSFDTAVKALGADCAATVACSAANPNLVANFQKVARDLNANPALLTVRDPQSGRTLGQLPLTGDDFVNVMFQLFYSTQLVPFLPDMITRSANGNFTWLENLLPLVLGGEGSDPTSLGMHFSVVCSKDPSLSNLDVALAGNQNILPEIRQALEPSIKEYFEICSTWPSKNADPKGTSPASFDVPTTLVSGQFDPITPPSYADIADETLPNATRVTLPGGGHSAIIPSEPVGACGLTVMLSLIASGTTPDTSCVGTLQTTYRVLPPVISGDPVPSPSPSPSATPQPSPQPSPLPSAPPSALPSPPATGNGGNLPGLPNTGAGALSDAGATTEAPRPAETPVSLLWWLALPIALLAPLGFRLRSRSRRS